MYSELNETDKKLNLVSFDPERACGPFQIPTLKACEHVPTGLLSFDEMTSRKGKRRTSDGIHFFIHDTRFEKFWKHPGLFIDRVAMYDCALSPDYSVYIDMPMAMKIWNVYRGRLLGQIMQDYGITVIPSLTWAGPDTYDLCFDGIEQGGTVAVSTVGCMRCGEEARRIWADGMNEAVRRIEPKTILIYGHQRVPEFDPRGAEIRRFEAYKFDKGAIQGAEERTTRKAESRCS